MGAARAFCANCSTELLWIGRRTTSLSAVRVRTVRAMGVRHSAPMANDHVTMR